MGGSNSKSSQAAIKNGDWEHRLCWMDTSKPGSAISEEKVFVANAPRRLSLTRASLRLRNSCVKGNDDDDAEVPKRKKWQRLQETNLGIEMASLASSTHTEDTVI